MREIDKLRKKIDKLDDKIINLLNKRFDASRDIGAVKAKSGMGITDGGREKFIFDKIGLLGGEHAEQVAKVYGQIISGSKEIQNNITGGENGNKD